MTKIEHLEPSTDIDQDQAGWYIVEYDESGYSYDAIGPYDSKAEAERVCRETRDKA